MENNNSDVVDSSVIKKEDIKFFDPPHILGKGTFGTVQLASLFGMDVAVKLLDLNFTLPDIPDMKKYIDRELALLKALRHPNIVQFIGLFSEEEKVYIIMEYISNGSLQDWNLKKEKKLPWRTRIRMALDGARALAYLHAQNVLHRDVKSENFLVDEHMVCKVCDFGFARAKLKESAKQKVMTILGTEEWMAPEVMLGMEYGSSADVFSFGLVLCEMMTRMKVANFPRTPQEGFALPVQIIKEKTPEDCPAGLFDLILKCVDHKPGNRYAFEAIVEGLKKILDCVLTQESREIEEFDELGSNSTEEKKEVDLDLGADLLDLALLVPSAPSYQRLIRAKSVVSSSVLMSGENILYEFSEILDFSSTHNEPDKQKLVITNYRAILIRVNLQIREALVSIPLLSIYAFKVGRSPTKGFKLAKILCTDFNAYSLGLPIQQSKKITSTIKSCARNLLGPNLFAFNLAENLYREDGWNLYDPVQEFQRLEVMISDSGWRSSEFNSTGIWKNFPPQIYVPSNINEIELDLTSKGFVVPPILSWKKAKKRATLLRSGDLLKCNLPEQAYLIKIHQTNPSGKVVLIYTEGKGKSKIAKLDYLATLILGLEAHSASHNYYKKLLTLVNQENEEKWLLGLDESHLFQNLNLILESTSKIANLIQHGHTCIIMSPNGVDRNSQLLSLAQLLLDPFYRTIKGFEILIEKEWLSFGHKFYERFVLKHDFSPIFFEFIDCVFQLTVQFPQTFEFNQSFLLAILDHCHYAKFGTFLCDNWNDKKEKHLEEKTFSLWSFLNEEPTLIRNTLYVPTSDVLFPTSKLKKLQFWGNFYSRRERPFSTNQ